MNFEPILYGPLFTRDAQDVNLVAASADPVDVTVSSGGLSWTVPVTPVLTGGRYLAPLRMREILASVVLPLGLQDPGTVDVPMVTLSAGDASMSFRAIRGAAAGKTPAQLAGHWLSWRDQVSKTYTWGRERLTFLAGLDLLGWRSGSYAVSAKVYFQDADPVTITLASGTLQAGCQFVTVDASFAAIAARVSGIPRAWDVSYSFAGRDSGGSAASIDGYPLRLVVSRADVRVKEFIFCNSFGVEDRVYSSGRSNPKLEGTSVAFLNGGAESELRNDAEEGREVYSGYLASAREAALWLDFLKAYDRRIILDGIPEKIVVDSQETDLQDNAIGSVKFTYHLAYLDAGRFFQDAEGLGDYDPEQQYGALYVGDDPASEDLPVEDLFFLKTRLDEFPAADLTEELLFLVQNPLTQAWGNAPLSGLKDWLQQAIHAERTPVWAGPWEDYQAGVADYALAAALGKDLDDRIRAIEQSPFALPVATDTVLGGIKVGEGLSIDGNGVLSVENPVFFQQGVDLATLVELKPDYAYLGVRNGIFFEVNAETYVSGDTVPDLYVKTVNGKRVLYSPLPFITGGDQIIIDGDPMSGGGGGSASNLYDLLDIYGHEAETVKRADGTNRRNGDLLAFNSTLGMWVALDQASVTTDLSDYYTKSQTNAQITSAISALNLGAASTYGIGSVTSGNTGLVTGGAVYSYVDGRVNDILDGAPAAYDTLKEIAEYIASDTSATAAILADLANKVNTSDLKALTFQAGAFSAGSYSPTTAKTINVPTTLDHISDGSRRKLSDYKTIASLKSKGSASLPVYFDANGNAQTITDLDILSKTNGYVKANRFYLNSSVYFYIETVNGTHCVKLNAPFVTDGDQIIISGTPQGGSGGGSSYLNGLEDVYVSTTIGDNNVLVWDNSLGTNGGWKNVAASSIGTVVSVSRSLASGIQIGSITVNGVSTTLFAPEAVTSLPWNSITGRPTDLNDFTNNAGYIKGIDSSMINTALGFTLRGDSGDIYNLASIASGASAGASAYQLPATGIPYADLHEDVQASLDLADSALQSISTLSLFGKSYDGTANVSITTEDIQGVLDSVYHPRGGDANLALTASTIQAALTIAAGGGITAGNGHTGGLAAEEGYRKYFFGGLDYYVSLRNFGTENNPVFGFYFNAPIVSAGDQVLTDGTSATPSGGSGGGSVPHVLLSESEWAELLNPDPSTIYLIYEG